MRSVSVAVDLFAFSRAIGEDQMRRNKIENTTQNERR